MDDFFTYLNTRTHISKSTWATFNKILKLTEYKSGSHLCKVGDYPKTVCFLVSGYARGYVLSHKDKEFNREIFGPSELISSLSALMLGEVSKLGIQFLTDSTVFCADFDEYMKLTKKNPELLNLYIDALKTNFIKLEQRTIQLSTMNATERYIALRNRIPNIDDHISQYHIASHLGITPIQLSRVRRELFSK